MATAKMSEKVVMVPTKEKVITLELNEAEARTLMAIWSRVGGSPAKSPRGWMQNIAFALKQAGVPEYDKTVEYSLISDRVRFDDYNSANESNAPGDRLQGW